MENMSLLLRSKGFSALNTWKEGSLDKHISDEPCKLDWQKCFKIIKGVRQGLNYLHNGNKESIYHLDLKPENILLDNNRMPKIGDLGISRIFSSQRTCTTATRMMGTLGFMPPEYINKQKISQKYDVFSLGVIIIQIMAGRKGYYNCGSIPSEKFIELVCEKWRERLDAKIWSHTSPQVKTCIQIAVKCVEDDPQKRPTMSEIIDDLNTIDIETLSLTDEASNLQSRGALAYNQSTNSAPIGVHDSSNRFESPIDAMDYEHEPIMRNLQSGAIGGRGEVAQTSKVNIVDDGYRLRNPNIRLFGVQTLLLRRVREQQP